MSLAFSVRDIVHGHDADACDRMRSDLVSEGFARFDGSVFGEDPVFKAGVAALMDVAARLPADPYGAGAGRMRVFGKAVRHPDIAMPGNLAFQKERVYAFNGATGVDYFQPAESNPEHGGIRRVMKGLPDSLHDNAALLRMIGFFFDAVPFDDDTRRDAMQIGVHIVRMEPGADLPAVASPNCLHTDGEPYTCGVLLDRVNAEGGENFITPTRYEHMLPGDVPPEEMMAQFTLERLLDGYVVKDDSVAHYVSPVARADPGASAHRTILLIEFVPLRPFFVRPGQAA
jgi:hypothetical protein